MLRVVDYEASIYRGSIPYRQNMDLIMKFSARTMYPHFIRLYSTNESSRVVSLFPFTVTEARDDFVTCMHMHYVPVVCCWLAGFLTRVDRPGAESDLKRWYAKALLNCSTHSTLVFVLPWFWEHDIVT